MADEDLDTRYWVPPQQFTAERARLAAAASARGDDAAAQRISAARKPTAAAWIVNRLALRHKDAQQRLAYLGERLRAAHAALDGARIRELSAEQHRLIDELTDTALRAADVREDLTGTLQAAVADPQVRARLGRLTRPERWSGFGDLGDLADVGDAPSPSRRTESRRASPRRTGTRRGCAPPSPPPKTPMPGPTRSCPSGGPDAMRTGSSAARRPGSCGTPNGNCAAPRATTTRRKRPAASPRKRCSRPGPGYDRAEPAVSSGRAGASAQP